MPVVEYYNLIIAIMPLVAVVGLTIILLKMVSDRRWKERMHRYQRPMATKCIRYIPEEY